MSEEINHHHRCFLEQQLSGSQRQGVGAGGRAF